MTFRELNHAFNAIKICHDSFKSCFIFAWISSYFKKIMLDNLMQWTKVISEWSICSNCWKCSFSMIWKDKFSATKILHNIFFQFCWLNWDDKSVWLFFYKYINFALSICIIILNLHDWKISSSVKESWVVFIQIISCKHFVMMSDHQLNLKHKSSMF